MVWHNKMRAQWTTQLLVSDKEIAIFRTQTGPNLVYTDSKFIIANTKAGY
jgi:hypothetical protein